MKFCLKLIVLTALCCPITAFAELPEKVEADFAVLNGVIVMPLGEEYVVDLDASNGLHEGDVLTLVTPGKKIIHPDTHEVIGAVSIPDGFLQVTRILSGYSYAKPLTPGTKPQNGAKVSRFEQVPAIFVDQRKDEGAFSRQFTMDLPQLKWLPEDKSEQALLTFTLEADTLSVRTADGNLLHRYSVNTDQDLISASPSPQPAIVGSSALEPKPKLLQQISNSVVDVLHLGDDRPFQESPVGIIRQGDANQRGVWIGPNLGGNPVGITVADFDGDTMQETAVALNDKLLIAQILEGAFTVKNEVAIPSGLQVLSLDSIDLDGNGRPELYLTAIDGYSLASFVVQFEEGEYRIIRDKIAWYLRVVELPGNKISLIGQAKGVGRDITSFYGKPFLIHLDGNRLVRGEDIDLPEKVNIYSFVPITDNENRLLYVYLTQGDYLKVVTAEGVELWESDEYFGGSESCFYRQPDNRGELEIPVCIGPRMIKAPNNEILVVQNIGQRMMQRYIKYKDSLLVSMSWNGYSMVENWRTAGQRGYLGDFALADAQNKGRMELVMAVKFKHKGLIDPPRSAIVTYKLN